MTKEVINYSKETIAPPMIKIGLFSGVDEIALNNDVPCEHCTCGKKG